MNLAFWAEAHKRAEVLLEGVANLAQLAKEGRMSEFGLLFDRLRQPSGLFREHCLTRRMGCGAGDLFSLLVGAACVKVSLDGWQMFGSMVNDKDFDPVEFTNIWHSALKGMCQLLLDRCRSEAAPTN